MPIPTPKKDESKKDFFERCMGDDIMVDDYPDEKQRYAICNSQWKEKKSALPFIERRYIPIGTEFRFDSERNEIEGYGAVFNTWYDVFGFREKVLKGAFKRTIKGNDIRSLFNHEPNLILGRNKAGTLEITEDEHGLHYRTRLPNTTYANDLRESIDRGDVTQCSIGFQVVKEIWDNGYKDRSLEEVKLFDVGPVTFPASEKTEVKLRSAMLDMGIDYNILNLIIVKSNRGIELEENEIETLRNTISIFGTYIPQVDVPLDEHTSEVDPVLTTRLSNLVDRRIQLFRKKLGG